MLIDNIEINAQSVSSVRDIQDTDAEITPVPGGVQVVTDTETPVSIYTIEGIILVNAEPVRGRRTFTIPSVGLYIIAAGDTVRRLALRSPYKATKQSEPCRVSPGTARSVIRDGIMYPSYCRCYISLFESSNTIGWLKSKYHNRIQILLIFCHPT